MFDSQFKISNLTLSNNTKALIIAEIGINHEGDFNKCLKLISSAALAGADLVKMQILDPKENYCERSSSYKLYKKSILSDEKIFNIYNFCRKNKIKLFSTFDRSKFEFYKKLNPICYKVSSSLLLDVFLIKDLLKTNKPILVSTGMSDLKDIDFYVKFLSKSANKKICLMHCMSLYPTPIRKTNLMLIEYLKKRYKLLTGFSDHSNLIDTSVAAIHYGAKIIEKHFTFDSKRAGYDHGISLNFNDFLLMVKKIRLNEKMIGNVNNKFSSSDKIKIIKLSRRLQATNDIYPEKFIKKNDLKTIRINSTKNYSKYSDITFKIMNKKVRRKILKNSILLSKDFY
jgi:sialic acid synthase SpsE